jgi:hypothetical protein
MPTKTDRILSYLPGTFRALPRPTALYAVADSFGNELLQAENSLAALMLAHWVDHADRGAEFIQDLACIAALYGLAPQGSSSGSPPPSALLTCPPVPSDESIEEFREHLRRYIRTFLEGTVTVQGIVRIVAEALGLHINDQYHDMDTWWQRRSDELIERVPRGDDALSLLFAAEAITATGRSSQPARITSQADLSAGVDLRGAGMLRMQVDAAAPITVDLLTQADNPAQVTLQQIVDAIRATPGAPIADHDQGYLTLSSPTAGPASRLVVHELPADAAPLVLGLLPHTYRGAAATAATVLGTVGLSGALDLTDARYLRLRVDDTLVAEIDCAGPDPAATTLDQIVGQINAALGASIAARDGDFLRLTSPTTGFRSSIAFQSAAAQDALERLFGPVAALHTGRDAQPAISVGSRDLRAGIDLSAGSYVRIRIDLHPPVMVNCAGSDPAHTSLSEIVAALNSEFGLGIASHDGRFVRIATTTTGTDSLIVFEPLPPDQDAAAAIFGIVSRVFGGTAATPAHLVGLEQPVPLDLRARYLVQIAIDDGAPVVVDLRAKADDAGKVTPAEISAAINAALGQHIAAVDGAGLSLTAPTVGAASRITIQPLEQTRRRRFVSRAFVSDEAATALFGFVAAQAVGQAAAQVQLIGDVDLSRGVDLREARFLRIAVDDQPARDVDCAARSPRPRVALPDEIVMAINDQLGLKLAAYDGRRLVLTSPGVGAQRGIRFEPPRAADALGPLLGLESGTWRGREATGVRFVGTVDLSAGIDLPANAAIKLGIDDADPIQIDLTGDAPAQIPLIQIVLEINRKLPTPAATPEAGRIALTSSTTGSLSMLRFEVPDGVDVTRTLFGIGSPRVYHGNAATRAQVVGRSDLSGGVDLRVARILRISIGGQPHRDLDCAALASNPQAATLDAIRDAINTQLGVAVAAHDGQYLSLTSPSSGASAGIDLQFYTGGDARTHLLGAVPETTVGSEPLPAVIMGAVDLLAPVNLAERRVLRLVVDGGRPIEVDVAGVAPATTLADEVIAKINAVVPGLASITTDHRLCLTSPLTGERSRLELLPLRTLEVVEYLPRMVADPPRMVRHGDRWVVHNDGVADSDLEVELYATNGVIGPTLVNRTSGERVRLMAIVQPGERVRLARDPRSGLSATIEAVDGTRRVVPPAQILAGPLGAQAWVPFAGEWWLSSDTQTLQLNNPQAPSLVVLRTRSGDTAQRQIAVSVVEADLRLLDTAPLPIDDTTVRLTGRVQVGTTGYRLLDATGAAIADLRAAADVALDAHRERVVAAYGQLYPQNDALPLLIVVRADDLFTVTLRASSADGPPIEESYAGVTIGLTEDASNRLERRIAGGALVQAQTVEKGAALTIFRGRSEWTYQDCYAARFDRERFDAARFARAACTERGIFNVSRFARMPPEVEVAVFAGQAADPPVELTLRWQNYQPGSFAVNLPADLPEQFGGRFGQARFGKAGDQPEEYPAVVMEPITDPNHIVARITAASALVEAAVVADVPPGWTAQMIPLRRPRIRTLTGGTDEQPAQIYLAEDGVPGFVRLQARTPGAWGNAIAVTVRQAGPGFVDATISYQGARFENARQVALTGQVQPNPAGEQLATLTADLLRPAPVGVLQAKAAGISANVTRDRTE